MKTKRLARAMALVVLPALIGLGGCSTVRQFSESVSDAFHGRHQDTHMTLREMDRNGDRRISKDEWNRYPAHSGRWSDYDRNANNELDRDELAAFENTRSDRSLAETGGWKEDDDAPLIYRPIVR